MHEIALNATEKNYLKKNFFFVLVEYLKARFHYERGRAFFVSFIDLRLKRAQKKSNKTNKKCFFHARSGNGP